MNNTIHVAAQWPFLQADYPSRSLCYIKKRGENRAPKKRKGGLYSSNQCCPLCCLTFEGLVINDCRLLYLNVSPQLPGTALIGSGTCRWPRPIARPPNSPASLAAGGGWLLSHRWMLHPLPGGKRAASSSPRLLPVLTSRFFVFLKEKEGKRSNPNRSKILKGEKKKIKKLGMFWGKENVLIFLFVL